MNLLFLQGALWPMLFIASAPLLLHLFARARPRNQPFSSVRFLEQVVRKTSRLQRPKSWLILLLRTLLFLAVLLAILQPVWMRPTPLAEGAARRQVVLVVDQSASMAAVEGAGTRFSRSVARADEILSSFHSEDLVNVVWMRGQAKAEFPVPGTNRGALREALREARPSSEAADVAGALALAMGQVDGAESGAEIYVLSDFQPTNWEGVALPSSANMTWVFLAVAEESIANQSLTRLLISPAEAVVGEEVTLLAEVANFSDAPVLKSVFLRAGELTERGEVRLPPGARGAVAFPLRFSSPGSIPIEVTLDEDGFMADNVRYAILKVVPTLRVALAGDDEGLRQAWERALAAIEWIDVRTLTGQVGETPPSPENADVLMIAGWTGQPPWDMATLQQWVEAGGTLCLAPGEGLFHELEKMPPEASASPVFALASAGPWREEILPLRLQKQQPDHPVWTIFGEGEYGDPAGGTIQRRSVPEDPTRWAVREQDVLLAYTDGTPAVVLPGIAGGGSVIWWNLGLGDAAATDTIDPWAARPEFVPFLGELLLQARRAETENSVSSEPLAGQRLVCEVPVDVLPDEGRLRRDEVEWEAEFVDGRPPLFLSPDDLPPGIYEWVIRDVPAGLQSINFPAIEADLVPGEPPALEGEHTVHLERHESVQELREGRALWPLLALMAVAFACAEGVAVWKTRPKI